MVDVMAADDDTIASHQVKCVGYNFKLNPAILSLFPTELEKMADRRVRNEARSTRIVSSYASYNISLSDSLAALKFSHNQQPTC